MRGHAVDNRITLISQATGAVTPFDLNSNVNYAVLPNLAAKTNALAQPTAIVFEPGGSYLYVAAFGSDRIAQVDPGGSVLARIELCPTAPGSAADPRNKRGPRGLALNAAAQRLYVLNRLANTLCIIDTAADTVLKEIPVGSYDPTPATIRQGRGFLYDAKLSGNGTMACAACHIDSEMDLLAWDLGDPGGDMVSNVVIIPGEHGIILHQRSVFHPMKGPMTTQTLRGLQGLDPLHWRGDRTNFLHFNIAFPGLLGRHGLVGRRHGCLPRFHQYDCLSSRTPTRTWTARIRQTSPAAMRRRGSTRSCSRTTLGYSNAPSATPPLLAPAQTG